METKRKTLLKALAGFSIGALLVSGLVLGASTPDGPSIFESPVTDASAGVSGGGGGGGGGGSGGTGYARWMEASKNRVYNGTIGNLPGEMWDSTCQNAAKYFVLVPNVVSDGNFYNDRWTFSLYGVRGLQGSYFGNGSSVANQIASNVGQSYQWAADYMYQKNFICLDNPNRWTNNEWRYEVRWTGDVYDALDETGVAGYHTQVDPQPILNDQGVYVKDPVGKNNLNTERSTVNTNFGRELESFRQAISAPGADRQNIVAMYKARLQNAKAADSAAPPSASLSLNAGNQEGLGEGGILNISEFKFDGRATASTKTSNWQVWRCGWDHYSQSGWQPTGCEAVGGSIDPNNLRTDGRGYARWENQDHRNLYTPTNGATSWQAVYSSFTHLLRPQENTGFYQIISAHCNAAGFAALQAELTKIGEALTKMDSGDSTGANSGIYKTKFYSQKPAVLPVGDSAVGSASPARLSTSRVGFFDKECPFDCTPATTGVGASTDNDAVANQRSTPGTEAVNKGLYGAVSQDGINSNFMEMFRDNQDREIKIDTWYPLSKNGVKYSGEPAKTTMFTRWGSGTPTVGEEFNATALRKVKGADGKYTFQEEPLFLGSGTATENQKNFDAAKGYTTSRTTQITGHANKLKVKASWASTSGLPQVIQTTWEYSPQVLMKIPTGVSFNRGSGQAVTTGTKDIYTNVDGRCWAEFGTDTPQTATVKKDMATTGSYSTTAFSPILNASEKTSRNLILNFVRAAGS